LNRGIIYKCLAGECPQFSDMFSLGDLSINYLCLIADIIIYAALGMFEIFHN
jgi:hypothetical protein